MTERLERDVGDLARKWVPDPRLGVLDVAVLPAALTGCTTSRDALEELRRIAAAARRAADIRLLPDGSVRDEPAGVTTAAVAPLLREPARRDMAAGARARRLPRLGPRGLCGDRV